MMVLSKYTLETSMTVDKRFDDKGRLTSILARNGGGSVYHNMGYGYVIAEDRKEDERDLLDIEKEQTEMLLLKESFAKFSIFRSFIKI